MFIKGLIGFTVAVVLIAVIFFFSWNYIIVQLPIEGIVIKPLVFNQAINLAFVSVLLEVVSSGILRLFKRILE